MNKSQVNDNDKVDASEVITTVNADNCNIHFIRCIYCHCLILKPTIAKLECNLQKKLPRQDGNNEPEEVNKFWLVEDIFDFENVTFSKTVDNMKFLSCCDCDIGPLGYQDLDNKKCYLAHDRVHYFQA